MRRIKEERLEAVTSQPEALPRAQWLSWRRAYVGLATVAFLALIVGLGVATNMNGSKEPGSSDDYQLLSGAGTASETDLASLPSRVRLAAVDSQVTQGPRPVNSLTAAISAVASGGTVEIADTVFHGAVLINKPVRLVAPGGEVKIGAL
ncbi:MAG TPA: hypothetical protein EYN96_08300 [Candidatus Hydrogenedentes bacterium]|nr:hypothetical protein [Candidatus Hydrogenedentota bacterium]